MSLNKKKILSLTLIIVIAAGSYLVEYASKEYGLKSASMIKVTLNGRDAAFMDMDLLGKLKMQELTGQDSTSKASTNQDLTVQDSTSQDSTTIDDVQRGPELLSVLTASGIGEFRTVEIKGLNPKSVFRTQKAVLNPDFVFYFTKRGTVDLYQGNNPRPLVEDVAVIDVTK